MARYFVPDFTVKYITHFIPVLNITVPVICPLCKNNFQNSLFSSEDQLFVPVDSFNTAIGPAVTFHSAPDEVLGALGNTEVIQLRPSPERDQSVRGGREGQDKQRGGAGHSYRARRRRGPCCHRAALFSFLAHMTQFKRYNRVYAEVSFLPCPWPPGPLPRGSQCSQ